MASCRPSCSGADAGLIPYARNELTNSIFPMKVYEYLAAGLPVVATPLPALEGVEEVAPRRRCAGNRARCSTTLWPHDSPAARAERSRSAAGSFLGYADR